jgi:predicted ATPase
MVEFPAGTVTFVFTDIEGSTRLLDELGSERYAEELADHRRAIRAAFASGREVDTQGDAFFYAFKRASDAITACSDALAALASGPIRVRVGMHTGEPVLTDEGYVGVDVHRAARIAGVAHGGQVVVSRATRDLVPEGDFVDLGEHRLKDLMRPEHLFQHGLSEFPPLRSLNRSNLPILLGPLVGRERELAEVTGLIEEGQRLVTIVGPGGTGKTRLAIQAAAEVADQFPDGVTFVPLAEVQDPAVALHAAAEAAGVRLVSDLAHQHALLVLDNFEHLTGATPALAALLQSDDAVRVLSTSRVPLRIVGELEYRLEPLERPAAVRLLRERARGLGRVIEENEVADELCARLDDLPLAIELAAARLRSVGADRLLDLLSKRLPLLTHGPRGAPARQRTLEATISWSYDLLDADAQAALARLSVFPGSFTLAAAESVAGVGLDRVDELVEASLVKSVDDGARLLLLETIREFAVGRLGSADCETLETAHAHYYLDFLAELPEAFANDFAGLNLSIAAEFHNVREALYCADRHGDSDRIVAACDALAVFWNTSGCSDLTLSDLIERAVDSGNHSLQQRALVALSILYRLQGNDRGVIEVNARRLALAREGGKPDEIGRALNNLAMAAWQRGEIDEARRLFAESGSVASFGPNPNLAMLELSVGELDAAEVGMRGTVADSEERGDPGDIAFNRIWLAWVRYLQEDGEEAALLLSAALIHASTIGGVALTDGLRLAACLAADGREGADAAALFGAAESAAKGQREWPYQTTGRLTADPKVRAAAGHAFDSDRRRGQQLDIPSAIKLAQQAADRQDTVAP